MKQRHRTCLKHLLLGFVLCLLLISFMVSSVAAGLIDLARPSQITIHYEHEKMPLPDVAFNLYRVADVSAAGQFQLTGDFRSYPVKINGLDASALAAAANTLYTYAVADSLNPMRTGKTDSYGQMVFTNLNTGLYLVIGQKTTLQGKEYTPVPILVSLPSLDSENNWQYEPLLLPKVDARPVSGEPQLLTRRVIKAWDDWSDRAEKRPAFVTVDLLCNGEVFDTVTLSEANSWNHVWPNLNASDTWLVVERNVPADYTVLYTASETIFRVTNAYFGEYPPETTTEKPSTDGGSETKTTSPDEPKNPNLPQTGQMWWPIPVSAGAGLLLFATGWFIIFRKRTQTDED
ncbi:MAG: Cna B-type domain-containing protein [Oscillospiraceae bacterium]|jgi:LPXTG-motif cell wall-anchored protein|nr:Cna B-type domain-containing protein [Oscillospiraceae bacterium]